MRLLPKKRIYLDFAASAPVSARAARVFSATLPYFGNPGALHAEARQAKTLLEEARTTIARLAEVKTDGVVFTAGATEANALAILGSVRAHGVQQSHILYHPGAHASVVGAVSQLESEGARAEALKITEGAIDEADLKQKLAKDTFLVILDAVCGETGTVWDTQGVRRILDAHAKNGSRVLLHVDASQAPLSRGITLVELGADMATLDAQKVGGVRGIGVLLMRQGITLTPIMAGGGQERGLRPGTENPMLASAFATALTEASETRKKFSEQASGDRGQLISRMQEIPNVVVNEGSETVPHILNISLTARDTDYLVTLLDVEGFAVSTKSACETDAVGSRAVLALTNDAKRSECTLRISWGPETKSKDLGLFADALVRSVRFLDDNAL